MMTLALVLALLAGLLHVGFFLLESVLFRRPFAYRTFGVASGDVELLSFSMLNQGFYNLFLAAGTITGVIGTWAGWKPQGPTLVVFGLLFMLGAALVLVISRPAMLRGALIQGLLPLIALILLATAA